jgi:cytochrome P450
LTGSAGRDGARFDAPDDVAIDRPQIDHLMFGSGPHRCAGRHVARLELRIALEELHAAFPSYRADLERPARRYTAMSRGVRALDLLVSV